LQDEVLHLLPARISERLRAAEVDGIGLYQIRIELVLADELAETVPDLGASAVAVRVLRRELLAGVRNCPNLLDRAETDSISFAQGLTGSASGCRATISAGKLVTVLSERSIQNHRLAILRDFVFLLQTSCREI
jgi:hypothetical protein